MSTTITDHFNDLVKAINEIAPGAMVEVKISNLPLPILTQFPNDDEDNKYPTHQRTEGNEVGTVMCTTPVMGLDLESSLFNIKAKREVKK